eukprot:6177196-Pleurochrysis_carterae.AAC.1
MDAQRKQVSNESTAKRGTHAGAHKYTPIAQKRRRIKSHPEPQTDRTEESHARARACVSGVCLKAQTLPALLAERVRDRPSLGRNSASLSAASDLFLSLNGATGGVARMSEIAARSLLLVAGELPHVDAVGLEALAEVEHHLLDERLHRRHVDDLEGVQRDVAVGGALHANLVQHGQHGHVRLAGAGWRAEQHVVGREEGAVVDARLDAVERLHALEGGARPLGHRVDGHERLLLGEGLGLERGHVHLLVALLLHAEGAAGQLALLVGHQVAARLEGQRLEVEHVAPDARLAGLGHGGEHVLRHGAGRVFACAHPGEVGRLLAHARLELLRLGEDLVRLEPRARQLVEHLGHLRVLAHPAQQLGALGLALRLRETRAHRDLPPVAEQQLDQVELVVVEQDHLRTQRSAQSRH